MKFCLLVTVALDIFIKEKNNTFISFVIFLCKRCLLGQTKRKSILLTIFRPPRIFQPPMLCPHFWFMTVSTKEGVIKGGVLTHMSPALLASFAILNAYPDSYLNSFKNIFYVVGYNSHDMR